MILDPILTDLRMEDLPEVAQKLARIVDIPTALRICDVLAGDFLRVPKNPLHSTRKRWIDRHLGALTDEEIAARLGISPDAVSLQRMEDRTRFGDVFGEREMSTVGVIVRLIANQFRVTISQMSGAARTADVMWPRQVAMYLVRQTLPHLTLSSIGETFGGRDHSTVAHSVMVVRDRMQMDADARTTIETLLTTILNNLPRDDTRI